MATNTSKYLGLHLWEPSDQVLRTEFNENWQKFDTAAAELREDLTQGLAGAAAENRLIRLGEPRRTTTASETMTFDLSGTDMSGYAALFLTVFAQASSGGLGLNANGVSVLPVCSNNGSQSVALVWLVPAGSGIAGCSTPVTSRSGIGGGGGGFAAVSWNAIRTLSISGGSDPGATATLYGIRA